MLLSPRRVLIIGASGFAGRALVPYLLRRGTDLVVASRDEKKGEFQADVAWRPMPDLSDAEADWEPLLRDCQIVIHLAGLAHGSVEDERHDAINHCGTKRLVQAAVRVGVERFVFVSSVAAQAGSFSREILRETDFPRPINAYGRSKLAAERAVQRSGITFTIVRPVAIYGAGAKGNMASLEGIADLPIPLPFAALTAPRSLLSIENFCSAIAFVTAHPAAANAVFLVADPSPLSVAEFIAQRRHAAGRFAGLYALSPVIIKWALIGLGRRPLWTRIGEPLVVSVDRLRSIGWMP